MRCYDFAGEEPIAQAKKWAKENLVGEYILKDSNDKEITYSINNRTISKYLSNSSINNSDSLGAHLAVLKKLPDVISESLEVEIHPDYMKDRESNTRSAKNGYNISELIHRFYGASIIDGELYRVKTTIIESIGSQKNKPHSFEVSSVELIEGSAGLAVREGSGIHLTRISEASSDQPAHRSGEIPVAKLLNGIEKSYDSGKKFLRRAEKRMSVLLARQIKKLTGRRR